MVKGNPEAYKAMYSRRDEITLANPFGPPLRGWAEISAAADRAATVYRDGEVPTIENFATVVTSDLAYLLEVERFRAKIGGSPEFSEIALRTTTVLRREDGEWKIVHRHADPITTARPPESVIQT
jgi:ketosteroid isomerase-like protein